MYILKCGEPDFPAVFQQMADPPPQIFVEGSPLEELLPRPRLAIVGSRKISAYGKTVTARLAGELAELGVIIVSGLAFGVDAVAHRAALEAGGTTIAVLACGVDRPYPAANQRLGRDLIKQGGALVSEYPPGSIPYKQNFIARNRLVSAFSNGVLITEAAQKSGSLHTARFALEQGREVLAVPGNITSETSVGTNNLIKTGASVVMSAADILHALGWDQLAKKSAAAPRGGTPAEQCIVDLLQAGIDDGEALMAESMLAVDTFNQALTMLEITGKVRALGNNRWALR